MSQRSSWIRGCLLLSALSGLSSGCYQTITVGADDATVDASVDASSPGDGGGGGEPKIQKLDLLVVIDNSNSMKDNQRALAAQLGSLVEQLTSPPCVSNTNPTPHNCNSADPSDHPVSPPLLDMNIAVTNTDLGTPGHTISGCLEGDSNGGDDALMNPIHFGYAMQHHEPWSTPSASQCPGVAMLPDDGSLRPEDCDGANTDPTSYPSYLHFVANSTIDATAQIVHDFRCNAGLYVCGCGLEQQLESAYRALVWHGAGLVHPAGSDSANAGFVRDDAVLAIVVLSDEEDGSVQNCNYAMPGEPCADHTDVYGAQGTPVWASDNPNLRFYLYTPGGGQDPTWPLDRYIHPTDPTRGFLALKPGHPERVVFAAITGVPLQVPQTTVDGQSQTDWDALLGAPGANGPDDFYGRQENTAFSGSQGNAPVTMQTGLVSGCTDLLQPACYRAGSTYDPSQPCSLTNYRAVPSRRLVEVARRFDQSALCNGQPCHNGMVASVCGDDYGPAFDQFVRIVQSRL